MKFICVLKCVSVLYKIIFFVNDHFHDSMILFKQQETKEKFQILMKISKLN